MTTTVTARCILPPRPTTTPPPPGGMTHGELHDRLHGRSPYETTIGFTVDRSRQTVPVTQS